MGRCRFRLNARCSVPAPLAPSNLSLVSVTQWLTVVLSLGISHRRAARALGFFSASKAVREQFHREEQRDRRPARHQHGLPLQRRRSRHIRRQRHRDTAQTHHRQQQKPIH
jgi:hypothetical protein